MLRASDANLIGALVCFCSHLIFFTRLFILLVANHIIALCMLLSKGFPVFLALGVLSRVLVESVKDLRPKQ